MNGDSVAAGGVGMTTCQNPVRTCEWIVGWLKNKSVPPPASSKGFCLDPRDGVWAPLIIHSAPFGRSRQQCLTFNVVDLSRLCSGCGCHPAKMTQNQVMSQKSGGPSLQKCWGGNIPSIETNSTHLKNGCL